MPEQNLVFIKDAKNLKITAKSPDGGTIESQSVEALLLFDIRHTLDEILSATIDVESALITETK